jgi:hypothetical protein
MAPSPGDLPTSSHKAQAPSDALRHGNILSRFLPPAPTMRSPAPLRCACCSASFPILQALCAHLNSSGTPCSFAPDDCQVLDTYRHLLAPCTFCGRYFRSGGLSRHQHSCFHRNTTPSQPPACGALLPRGRPSPVHPLSLSPAVQWCLDHGATGGKTSKPYSSPASFPSDLVRPRTPRVLPPFPPSVLRLVKLAFEELVGCVLFSMEGPPKGLPRKRFGRGCFYYSRA